MLMSKTPYRISLFGGGSDYPSWYKNEEGLTIGGAINKYSYITLHKLPTFFEHKYRLVYAKTELVQNIDSIQHPAIKAVLNYKDCHQDLEVHHIGDLPSRSGMGSSSSFTVGLLNAMSALEGKSMTPQELAEKSIHIEQDLMKEAVGSQDQVFAAYGGFNLVKFSPEGFSVTQIENKKNINKLEKKLMLFFTGKSRNSTVNASKIIKNLKQNQENIRALIKLGKEAYDIIENNGDISLIGEMLNESWERKKNLADTIIVPEVENLYKRALDSGALGGKVLGAGGGGFVLLFADEQHQEKIIHDLDEYLYVDFNYSWKPSQIILNPTGKD